jgi:nucleoside-diphosphate-sugar epimerase
MRVIVTGASGFLGHNLVLQAPKDWQITATYNTRVDFPRFVSEQALTNVVPYRCDLTDPLQIKKMVAELGPAFELCVYLAANGDPALSVRQPSFDLQSNTLGLVNFLDALQIKRLLYMSSGAIYDGLLGDVSPQTPVAPTLPYAISKWASECYVRFFHKKRNNPASFVNLRFFGAYGPYEPARKIYSRLVQNFYIRGAKEFTIQGNGKNLIDAMFVEDTIAGLLQVAASPVSDVTVDFCVGQPLTLAELVVQAGRILGCSAPVVRYEGEVPEYIMFRASPVEMETLFGFRPTTPLSTGLRRLAHFLERQETDK